MIAGSAERRPPDRLGIIPIVGSRRDFGYVSFSHILCAVISYSAAFSSVFYPVVAGDIGLKLK